MIYLETNALTYNGLLIAIKNFLAANGWTTLSDGTGGGGENLEMTNANGHDFKLSARTLVTNYYDPTIPGVTTFTDKYAQIAFQVSDIGGAAGYTVTPAESNDCMGPFSNVWLMTDDAATYCHVVMQTANSRYNHFSFGDINKRDIHAIDVPYAFGLYHIYWRTGVNYTGVSANNSAFNDIGASIHNVGVFCEDANTETVAATGKAIRVGVPDGILDPALGFTDGPVEAPILRAISNRYNFTNTLFDGESRFLDFLMQYDNQGHTGGVPIFPCPVIVRVAANTAHCYIGDLPGIGQVNMTGLAPAQVLDFAGEEWIVFPLKQYGTLQAANNGISPQPVTNSLNYGIALKKTDAP